MTSLTKPPFGTREVGDAAGNRIGGVTPGSLDAVRSRRHG